MKSIYDLVVEPFAETCECGNPSTKRIEFDAARGQQLAMAEVWHRCKACGRAWDRMWEGNQDIAARVQILRSAGYKELPPSVPELQYRWKQVT